MPPGLDGTVLNGSEIFMVIRGAGLTTLTMVGYISMGAMKQICGSTTKNWAGSSLEKNYFQGSTEVQTQLGFMTSQTQPHANSGTIQPQRVFFQAKTNFNRSVR